MSINDALIAALAFANKSRHDIEQVSSKNLLFTAPESKTVNGILFTVNEDYSITVDIPDTVSSNTQYEVLPDFNCPSDIKGKSVILSGAPSGGGASTWKMFLQNRTSGYATIKENTGGDTEAFTISSSVTKIRIIIAIYAGCPAQKITFYPMLRNATIEDNSYTPFAPSIRHLYQMIVANQS